MTRKVDGTLYIHAGPEIGVASTKAYGNAGSFSTSVNVLGQITQGNLEAERCRELIHDLKVIPQLIEEMLKEEIGRRNCSYKYEFFQFLIFRSEILITLQL